MARHRFEPVTGEIARREVVSQHRVQRVDQFTPRDNESDATARVGATDHSTPSPSLQESRGTGPPERERYPESARAYVEKGEVEAVQVVILDDVRIYLRDPCHETGDEVGFRCVVVASNFDDLGCTCRVAHRDHENAMLLGVEPGGLEIELHAVELIEGEIAKVRSPRCHQVLLLRRKHQCALLSQFAQVADSSTESV